MRWVTVVVAVVDILISAGLRPARACSGPWGIQQRESLPADGDVGVPTNTEIRVRWVGDTQNVSQWIVLRPLGGEPVELSPVAGTGTSFDDVTIQRPTSLLAPDTVYEVLDSVLVPCDDFECSLDAPAVFATFTTGPGPDLTRPEFDGVAALTGRFSPAESDNSCGYYTSVYATASWFPATDDGPANRIRYRVYDEQGRLYAAFLDRTTVEGHVYCDGRADFWPIGASIDMPHQVVVRAVDLAGNEDGNNVVASTPACQPLPPPDAGPDATPSPDARTGRTPGDGDSSGCGCRAGAHGGSAASTLVLFLLALQALLWLARK